MSIIYDKYVSVLQVIEYIGQGMTMTKACDTSYIGVATVNKYLADDVLLAEMFEEAVQRGNDALADALLSPDNHALYGRSDPKLAKVMSDNIKWVLSKRDRRFADRIEHKHTLTADNAITAALEMARTRVQSSTPVLIDVTPVEEIMSLEEEAELAAMLS